MQWRASFRRKDDYNDLHVSPSPALLRAWAYRRDLPPHFTFLSIIKKKIKNVAISARVGERRKRFTSAAWGTRRMKPWRIELPGFPEKRNKDERRKRSQVWPDRIRSTWCRYSDLSSILARYLSIFMRAEWRDLVDRVPNEHSRWNSMTWVRTRASESERQ